MKACRTCKFLEKDSETVYNPHHGGNPGSTDWEETFFWCDHPDHADWEKFKWSRRCDKWEIK
jgi:RNA polymerase subunit RPABC4/transcription elongation factor Spt4